jgi:hypothetical protein
MPRHRPPAAAVVAQVEHEFLRPGRFERRERRVERRHRRAHEVAEEEIAHRAAVHREDLRERHGGDRDGPLARRGGARLAGARHEGERHGAIDLGRTEGTVDAAVRDERTHPLAVDRLDARATVEPGLGGRTALEDLQQAELAGDDRGGAETDELTLRVETPRQRPAT